MANSSEKQDARAIARIFGTERKPAGTSVLAFETPDIAAVMKTIMVDELPTWLDEALDTAKAEAGEEQASALAIHRHYRKRSTDLMVMRAGDLARLVRNKDG